MFPVSPISHSGQKLSNLKWVVEIPKFSAKSEGYEYPRVPLADWQLKDNLAEDLAL